MTFMSGKHIYLHRVLSIAVEVCFCSGLTNVKLVERKWIFFLERSSRAGMKAVVYSGVFVVPGGVEPSLAG